MPLFDLPLEALQRYRPDLNKPADFGAFWDATLAEARAHPLNPVFAKVETPLKTVESYDVTFAGYGGQSIKAWLSLPVAHPGTSGKLPCVVEYIGYGGGRGFPSDWLLYPSAGYAHLVMDTRGQGSGWSKGDTPDLPTEGSSPHTPGFMTLGVLSPQTYYYRRLFTDAVRAVEAARAFDHVDVDRVAVTGGSQGGGVSLAVAGLVPDVALVLPDVPFLCHYRRATELVDTHPYAEISRFCNVHRDRVETVFHTLSYFDGVNFAAQAQTRALFSVALMDTICPPSTVYAAYNHYAGPKDINVYSYNGHEGGQSYQSLAKLAFLNEHLPL